MTHPATTSYVVELAGLPGSGKTTVAALLRDRLVAAGLPCTVADAGVSAAARKPVRAARRAGYVLREVVVAPAAARRATTLLARSGQEGPRDTVAVVTQWLATEHLVRRGRRSPGVHLHEEGVVQTTWTAALRARHLRVDELLACLPASARIDLVLYLDAQPELAASRLAARSSRHSRTQRLEPGPRIDELRRGRLVMDEILVACPLRIIRLPADEPVEALADRASAAVLRMTAEDGAPRSPDLR